MTCAHHVTSTSSAHVFVQHPAINLRWKIVSIDAKTDLRPSETSWKATEENNSVAAAGGLYSSKEKSYDNERRAHDGTRTLTIDDGHEDVACCAFGHGYFKVRVGGKFIEQEG